MTDDLKYSDTRTDIAYCALAVLQMVVAQTDVATSNRLHCSKPTRPSYRCHHTLRWCCLFERDQELVLYFQSVMFSYTLSSCRNAWSNVLAASKESQPDGGIRDAADANKDNQTLRSLAQSLATPSSSDPGKASSIVSYSEGQKEALSGREKEARGNDTEHATLHESPAQVHTATTIPLPRLKSPEIVTVSVASAPTESVKEALSVSENEAATCDDKEKDSFLKSPNQAAAPSAGSLPRVKLPPKHCLDVLNIRAVDLPNYARQYSATLSFPEKVCILCWKIHANHASCPLIFILLCPLLVK
jgi:hypothetical protein